MTSGRKLLALLLVLPQLALGGGLKLVAELPDVKLTGFVKASAQRFVRLRVEWDRSNPKRPVPHYQLFDLQDRKVVDVPIPTIDMPKSHKDILGRDQPMFELVHFDGQVVTLTLNAYKGNAVYATYLSQYDQRTGRFSELVQLAPWEELHHYEDIGVDPSDRYFYFASATFGPGQAGQRGIRSADISRIDLKTRAIDWTTRLELPVRDRPLTWVSSASRVFSRNGTRLAIIEYADEGTLREHRPDPQQQVAVIDIPSMQVDLYPAPQSAYGAVFSPDDRYLILGSNETGKLTRIDLRQKKIDLEVQGHKLQDRFVLTPSGNSFLVISNTILASPKVVEVRRIADLKLQASIPVRLLFPGSDGVTHELAAGLGGRALLLPFVDDKGWSRRQGVRLYEVAADVLTAQVEGSGGGDLSRAMAAVLGKQYADEQGLRYEEHREDPNATFAKAVPTKDGDVCVTAIHSLNSDGDFKAGRTSPVVARLDSSGKARWKKVLTKKGFLDYEDGGIAATPDGGCVVSILSYVQPGRHPLTRLVKLDAKGKVLWDHHFAGTGGAKTRLGDTFELLPDGSVQIIGRYYDDPEDKSRHDWKAVVDPSGRVVSDVISP